VKFGTIKKNPLLDSVTAISVGIVNGRPLVDLNYEEDSKADVDMNVVMTGSGRFVEVQATGEKVAFDDEQMASMLMLARRSISELGAMQKAALEAE
jgi:ribonuclease PH